LLLCPLDASRNEKVIEIYTSNFWRFFLFSNLSRTHVGLTPRSRSFAASAPACILSCYPKRVVFKSFGSDNLWTSPTIRKRERFSLYPRYA
jgi:hypothetical protein